MALLLEKSGETPDEVLARHGLSIAAMEQINLDPVFHRRVADYRTEVSAKGLTFRVKARAQAEELLQTSWLLIHDPFTSPAVKADLIKSTVKWAGLEVQPEGAATAGGGVRITINLGGQTLDVTATALADVEDAEEVEGAEEVRRPPQRAALPPLVGGRWGKHLKPGETL